MKHIRKRLTYANVMSSIAVFLIIGGATAFAALGKNTVGTKQLKKNAVTAAKVKKNAVTTAKIKNGAVTTDKIADLAVTTGKIASDAVVTGKIANEAVTTGKVANDAVTSAKLAGNERSEGFQVAETSGTVGPLPNLATAPTTVATLQLPAGGNYVVTAETELINTDIVGPTDHYTQCVLNDDGTEIGGQFSGLYSAGLFPAGGITVVGVSDGGAVILACRSDNNTKTFAFQRRIVAVRVGSVG